MSDDLNADGNVKQVVPFLRVLQMEQSVRYYVDGLGFTMKNKWVVDGKLRWCWLALGGAALMLQEFRKEGHDSWTPAGKVGVGVSLCFQCEEALAIYRQACPVAFRRRNQKSGTQCGSPPSLTRTATG
jgi:hypothetical protein